MWQQVMAYLTEWAPFARETAFLVIVCAFLALQFAKLRVRSLNVFLGCVFVTISIAYGASIWTLHAHGLSQDISITRSSTGILVQYGILWPLLFALFGLTIAFIGSGKGPSEKRES